MKKIFMLALTVTALAIASVAFAKADDAITSSSKQQQEKINSQRKETLATLKQEKEQWKVQRQDVIASLKQEKEKIKEEFKEKFSAEKCARIKERVQNKESNFDSKKEKHTKVYVNLVNRINKFIARFDEAKLDTTVLKSHLAELQTKIDKFKADYAAYAAKLKESKNYTCGHSEGEFKGVLLETKALLKTVHADTADIRTYVRTLILADIKALKAQMPKEEDDNHERDDDKEENKDGDN